MVADVNVLRCVGKIYLDDEGYVCLEEYIEKQQLHNATMFLLGAIDCLSVYGGMSQEEATKVCTELRVSTGDATRARNKMKIVVFNRS